MSFTPTPPPSYGTGPSATSSGDRVILRVGARRNPDSRPGSSTQPIHSSFATSQPTNPTYAAYTKPTQPSQSVYTFQPATAATQQIQRAAPTNDDDEVYTIRPHPSATAKPYASSSGPSISARGVPVHAGYTPAAASAVPASASAAASSSSSSLSRASSSKSLPLAVALGSDSYTMAALSPPRHIASSSSLRSLPGLDTNGPTIPIPSLLSPGQKIEVPLISSASFAADGGASQTRALKADFHKGVKSFLAEAKANLEELTAELFYEDSADEMDEEEDTREQEAAAAGTGDGQKMLMAGTPEKQRNAGQDSAASGPSRVTPALLSSASQKQLGSPRKTALLQQLLSLSAHMDEGLATLASRSTALAAKSAKGPAFETKSHALKFNKNEIQTLAAMTRNASENKLGTSSTPAGNYPDVSEQTKQTVRQPQRARGCLSCAGVVI